MTILFKNNIFNNKTFIQIRGIWRVNTLYILDFFCVFCFRIRWSRTPPGRTIQQIPITHSMHTTKPKRRTNETVAMGLRALNKHYKCRILQQRLITTTPMLHHREHHGGTKPIATNANITKTTSVMVTNSPTQGDTKITRLLAVLHMPTARIHFQERLFNSNNNSFINSKCNKNNPDTTHKIVVAEVPNTTVALMDIQWTLPQRLESISPISTSCRRRGSTREKLSECTSTTTKIQRTRHPLASTTAQK